MEHMGESSYSEVPQLQGEIVSNQGKWDSGHKPVALETLEKVLTRKISRSHPENSRETVRNEVLEKRKKLGAWLDAIDEEAVRNLGVFESRENPGVRFPFTKIRVRNVASSVQNSPVNPETEKYPSKVVVLFTPFIPPPGGGPDDIMNIIYDRVLTALPDIAERDAHHAKNITVYGLGLPTSKWGSISEEWLSDFKENGFSEYGKLYTEFLLEVFGQDSLEAQQKMSALFFAGSMGTVLADQTARQLKTETAKRLNAEKEKQLDAEVADQPNIEETNKLKIKEEDVWKNLTLLLNNPTGIHNPSDKTINLPIIGRIPLSAKGLQVISGFGAEAFIRMRLERFVRATVSGAKQSGEALSALLKQKGISPYESDQQSALKKDANLEAIKSLMKGNPLDVENQRIFIEQGMLDPATTTGEKIEFLQSKSKKERFFKAGKHALGMGVNFTHWMDPMRWPDKWLRGIESYEKAIGAQTQPIK